MGRATRAEGIPQSMPVSFLMTGVLVDIGYLTGDLVLEDLLRLDLSLVASARLYVFACVVLACAYAVVQRHGLRAERSPLWTLRRIWERVSESEIDRAASPFRWVVGGIVQIALWPLVMVQAPVAVFIFTMGVVAFTSVAVVALQPMAPDDVQVLLSILGGVVVSLVVGYMLTGGTVPVLDRERWSTTRIQLVEWFVLPPLCLAGGFAAFQLAEAISPDGVWGLPGVTFFSVLLIYAPPRYICDRVAGFGPLTLTLFVVAMIYTGVSFFPLDAWRAFIDQMGI